MRLKINQDKSAVARPEERHFVGFCLRRDPQHGTVEVLLSQRTKRLAMARIRELTPRQGGARWIAASTRSTCGCVGGISSSGSSRPREEFTLRALDAHIRRRLRAIVLKHWKRPRTIARNLVKLGVPRRSAWGHVYAGRRSTWALSHAPAVDKAMPVRYFTDRGLVRLVELHRSAHEHIAAPIDRQLVLAWE